MTRGQERFGPSGLRRSTRRQPVSAAEHRSRPGMVDPDVVEWRRIALDKQLPRPRFPAGLRAPSLVCAWALVALAVVSAAVLGLQGGDRPPQAVVDSQERLVRSLARSLNATVRAGTDQLEDAAEDYTGAATRNPAQLLETTAAGRTRWASLAVLRADTGATVASRGAPLPARLVPQNVKRSTIVAAVDGGEPAALVVVPLPDGQLLAGRTELRVRQLKLATEGRQTVLVGLRDGGYTAVQGAGVPERSPLERPVRDAVTAAAGGDVTSLTRPVAKPPGWSASSAPVAVVVAAPVGDLDIAVASTVLAPVDDGGPRWQGVPAAAALILLAGLAYLLISRGLVRPVRRLLGAAQAAACGEPGASAAVSRPWEVRRIAAALDPGRQPERRRGVTVVWALVAATVLLVCWPAAVVALTDGASEVPAQVVVDAENQITATASALGDVLDRGLTQVREVAERAGADAAADRRALERLNRTENRYRSLYVSEPDGKPALVVGREPLRRTAPVPDAAGIRLDDTGGRLPVIYAYARGANQRTVVGEFDLDHLSGPLDRVAGRGRVVDPGLRTILDTEGYRAFQPLVEGAQRAAVAAAVVGQTRASVVSRKQAGRWLVSMAPVAAPPSVAGLQWTVVAEWPVTSLNLAPNTHRRTALAMSGIALAIALTGFGWHYLVLVRPLRRLVGAADRLADGDTETVISPHRQDEIGAVAACLEICRQVRVDGTQRLGGAARLRGWEHDYTTVLPLVTRRRTAFHRSRKS